MQSQGDATSERAAAPDARVPSPEQPVPPAEHQHLDDSPKPPPADDRETILEVDHATLRFGGVVALNDVDFTIYKGEITVPAGFVFGLPVGLSFFAGAWSEPALLKYAFAFEQATKARRAPRFLKTAEV
jgi:hypothetical protein